MPLLTPEADPGGFLAHDVRTQIAERRKLIASMQASRSALYSVIMGQLSTESKARLKLSEHWLEIDEGKEPLELWLLIIQTHTAGAAGEARVDYKNVRVAYSSLRQASNESLSDYYIRFTRVLAQYDALGHEQPAEDLQAIDFIHGLDPARYASFDAIFERAIVH